MSIWAVKKVTEEPSTTLRGCFFQIPNGDYHLVGYVDALHEGRVSSKIVYTDNDNRLYETRSGRKYHLLEPTSFSWFGDAGYVLQNWLMYNGIDPDDIKILDSIPGLDLRKNQK